MSFGSKATVPVGPSKTPRTVATTIVPDGELRGRVAGIDVPGDHLRPGGCGHQEDRH
jgi:hypothetical protein